MDPAEHPIAEDVKRALTLYGAEVIDFSATRNPTYVYIARGGYGAFWIEVNAELDLWLRRLRWAGAQHEGR